MEQKKAEQIFESIKKDDLKLFSSLFVSQSDFNLCYGRFPLLSVLYLYGAYNILSKYEKSLLRIGNYDTVYEPFDLYKRFVKVSKKSLKLFALSDSKCYPVLMLGILDERELLLKRYKNLYKTVEISQILCKIYKLNQNIEIIVKDDKIAFPSKYNGKGKFKFKLLACLMSVVLLFSCFSMAFVRSTSGLGTKSSPVLITNESEFVAALSEKKKHYKLCNDIELSSEIQIDNFSGVIDGNGHKLILKNTSKPLFKNLNGTIKNLTIGAVDISGEISQNFSCLAEKVYGYVVNVGISLNIDVGFSVLEDTYISGIAIENYGVIDQVKVEIFGRAKNNGKTNCYVSGVAGENYGSISNCEIASNDFESVSVDISGIAITNVGSINSCYNFLNLSQTTNIEWHPNVSGIANTNSGMITNCVNLGKMFSDSSLQTLPKDDNGNDSQIVVLAGGIVCQNIGTITNCRNFGDIKTTAVAGYCYSGGIVSQHSQNENFENQVSYSKAKCSIVANSELNQSFAGGVAGFSSSIIDHSGFEGNITLNTSNRGFAGGIVGLNNYFYNNAGNGVVSNCYASTNFGLTNEENKDKVLFFGIVGLVQTTVSGYPVSNCYYVKNDTFAYDEINYPACLTVFNMFGSVTFSAITDNEGRAVGVESIDKIDSGVMLNDEI